VRSATVARDHDHAHEEDVDGDRRRRRDRRAATRGAARRAPAPGRAPNDQRQDDHEVFRALEGHPAQSQAPDREHGDRQRGEDEPRAVQRARASPLN